MKFLKNKSSRVLIIVMSTLFILALVIADRYYKYENLSTDPRVYDAHLLYEKYNHYAENALFDSVFYLMDTIESIYLKYEHYAASYEVGVLYNNRAAAYISMALNSNDSISKDSLLQLAEINALKSIELYSSWIETYENKNREEIKSFILPHFNNNDIAFENKNTERYIKKRVKQIAEAQAETPRRLSVSYTNYGIVLRHREEFDDAVKMYLKALELWPDNLAAENNLNVLFNQPEKKRSTLRKIFPKDRL